MLNDYHTMSGCFKGSYVIIMLYIKKHGIPMIFGTFVKL